MAQVKIYGIRENLNPVKAKLSELIHSCVVDALKFPVGKRAHRFFPLDRADFYYPETDGRTDNYTIIEISLMEGRSVEAKKQLIRLLFERVSQGLGIGVQDIEICISESPKHNWGFRGQPGDEIELNYKVEI